MQIRNADFERVSVTDVTEQKCLVTFVCYVTCFLKSVRGEKQ